MGVNEKLMKIQTGIKAPKNLRNTFGNYNYRNAEGIFEAVKPYLSENNCSLVVEDSIEACADRVYVKATATLTDNESGEKVSASAYAREGLQKKGMDDSQITGATSSYARKYALNGLFLLDDTKDADSDEHRKESEARSKKTKEEPEKTEQQVKDEQQYAEIGKMKISKIKVDSLTDKCKADGVDVKRLCSMYKVKSFDELTEEKFQNMMQHWAEIEALSNDGNSK